jgi:hypothetical protein
MIMPMIRNPILPTFDRQVINLFCCSKSNVSYYSVCFQLTAFKLSFPAREIIARVAILEAILCLLLSATPPNAMFGILVAD